MPRIPHLGNDPLDAYDFIESIIVSASADLDNQQYSEILNLYLLLVGDFDLDLPGRFYKRLVAARKRG